MKKFFTETVTLEGILPDMPVTLDVTEGDYLSFAQAVDVLLPENTEIVTNSDGTLTYIIDGVEVPLSVLEGKVIELNPEVGPQDISSVTLSGGGSAQPFDLGSIGPGVDLTDLLPPTALSFDEFTDEEITPFIDDEDSTPDIDVIFDIPLDPMSGAPSVDVNVSAVLESALPGGSNMGSGADETSGVLNISTGEDTIGSVVINGFDVTAGGTVITDFGVLTVSVDADGNYSYSYRLTAAINHPDNPDFGSNEGRSDDFTVIITDGDGDTASDDFVIGILDDGPSAVDDGVTQAVEDMPVDIDVFANDAQGADGVDLATGVAVVADSLSGTGTLVYNDDGTFTYTPGTAEAGVVTFEYTITLSLIHI